MTTDLDFLVGQTVQAFDRLKHQWTVDFGDGAVLSIECLWRLLENGQIRVTSNDDGQRFGLPEPIEAARFAAARIVNAIVSDIALADQTLDLRLTFTTGHVLEILPDSAGYEAWQMNRKGVSHIATGGGRLVKYCRDGTT